MSEIDALREQVRCLRAEVHLLHEDVNYHVGLVLCSYQRMALMEEEITRLKARLPLEEPIALKDEVAL